MGFERAFEMIVGGVRVTGETAGEWGLASRVVPGDQVLDTAMELARDIAANCAPLVMGLHKRLMWRAPDLGQQDYIDLETRALKHSMGRPDAIEGGMAYFEKRPPNWTASVSGEWPDWMDE